MLFKKMSGRYAIFLVLLLAANLLSAGLIYAEVLERVVAIVNDDVILLSELEDEFQAARKVDKGVTKDKVLDDMINRVLLLKQAKRFRIGISAANRKANIDNDKVIDEYIEKRIKILIHIPFEKIESYYMSKKEQFGDKNFYDVKDEIEDYLIEEELNSKLLEHVNELRKESYIRIQFKE